MFLSKLLLNIIFPVLSSLQFIYSASAVVFDDIENSSNHNNGQTVLARSNPKCLMLKEEVVSRPVREQVCSIAEGLNEYYRNEQNDFKEIHQGMHWILTEEFRMKDFEIKFPSRLTSQGRAKITFEGNQIDLFFLVTEQKIHYVIPPRGKGVDDLTLDAKAYLPCFEMKVDPKSRKSEIEFIYSGTDCDLPIAKRGTFLMNLADTINRTHFVTLSHLIDASQIDCSDRSNVHADLGFLKMLESGETWYEKFGFSSDKTSERDLQDIRRKLLTQSLSSVLNVLSSKEKALGLHIQSCSEEIKTIKGLVDQFRREKNSEDSLRAFLLWVWKTNCKHFSSIMRTFFQDTDADNDQENKCGRSLLPDKSSVPWLTTFKEFQNSIHSMSKIYFPECKKMLKL